MRKCVNITFSMLVFRTLALLTLPAQYAEHGLIGQVPVRPSVCPIDR